METVLILALFLPLLGFATLLTFSQRISRPAAQGIACLTVAASFLLFAAFLVKGLPLTLTLYEWIPVKEVQAGFTLHLDQLSLVMALIITGIGSLIHIYSIGYMDHEEDYARYFACLNFFIFAMLTLVLAGNLLLLFLGWEGVGLASYLLIGFWYTRPKAAAAATKAFVMNRIGDLGLLLGVILSFHLFGTGDIQEITRNAGRLFAVGAPVMTVLTLLYFIGAVGKSAQLPLHTWLPDAMEGPTPVSALIHAATMVTAGVYLVVRLHAIFELAPFTLQVIGCVGAATSLFAALAAVGQTDLKRVLAYSTVSQLGLMFLACGVSAYYAAMFHLTAHAFIKALLFLAAGNVVHMLHGTTEMEKMGGLSKVFKKTHWLFLIGVLALSGIPPLAAFFSKDMILEQASHQGFYLLFIIGMATSILTAFYLTRAYFLTFRGPRHEEKHLEEAPAIMRHPLVILALLSIFGGFFGVLLETFLGKAGVVLAAPAESLILEAVTWLATAGALLGVLSAAYVFTKYRAHVGPPLPLYKKAFYIDRLYWSGIVLPLRAVARFIGATVEPKFFQASLDGAAHTANRAAAFSQRMQSGQIRSYVAWMGAGMALLTIYFFYVKG